jgi:hypothetical protein
VTEFHGSKLSSASQEEIKSVEDQLAIAEVSSGEEVDSQDERNKKKEAAAAEAAATEKKDVETKKDDDGGKKEEKTQEQSAKDASKAGVSVQD